MGKVVDPGEAAQSARGRWLVCVDTGGTFTDCVAWSPSGEVRRAKVLSTGCLRGRVVSVEGTAVTVVGPWGVEEGFLGGFEVRGRGVARVVESRVVSGSHALELATDIGLQPGDACELSTGEAAPVLAARLVTGTRVGSAFPEMDLRLATTRGTNALLERRGGPTALFVTEGFRDVLRIGTQQRPELFAIEVRKPAGIECEVVEASGRLDAQGRELRVLGLEEVERAARRLVARGVKCAAVALMHAWKDGSHERRVGEALRACGFEHVSLSSEVGGGIGLLARTQTALVNAYLAPVVEGFVAEVSHGVGAQGSRLMLMTSAGGLVPSTEFRAKDSLLSGPAGGVVGASAAARASGFERVLTFDMGGTSTDVARVEGEVEYVYEHRVGVASVMAPAVAVESVAAGGGSVCWVDSVTGTLKVGPRSAGAAPGPACYGQGGPLTVTDVNLLLGRVDAARFQVPLDAGASRRAAEKLLAEATANGRGMSLEEMLAALLAVANEQMAAAMRTVSVQRGYDPCNYAMVAFGGAGGQHACGVADLLGVETVLVPRDVGLLSARGLSSAGVERFASRQVLRPLEDAGLTAVMAELGRDARTALAAQGFEDAAVVRRIVGVRLVSQEAAISVEVSEGVADVESFVRAEFARLFEQLYGYAPVDRGVEIESVRVVARAGGGSELEKGIKAGFTQTSRRVADGWEVVDRDSLRPGERVLGPAVVSEAHATTVVERGWAAQVDGAGALVVRRGKDLTCQATPVAQRELVTARLTAIASDMGETLRRTALSTNVKDRLDYSCAVLDSEGELVVNAPHIPVHLGALGLCVRYVAAELKLEPGDVAVTNHPAFGGSHLPDVTVVTPVFDGKRLIGYVASRAHHAEIGGILPGSMAPGARTLEEEGVVIPPMLLVQRGMPRLDDFRKVLLGAKYPTRAVEENLADVQAQLAANATGATGLLAVAREHAGAFTTIVAEMFAHVESRVRAALARRGDFQARVREVMDDGTPIDISVRRLDAATMIEIESKDLHPGNLNAPLSVTRSAAMYVLRLLVNEPIPLVERILRGVTMTIGPGMLNPRFGRDPAKCPAVAAGNVETSQRVVDALLKAFGVVACSQGTMNNVVFGNARFGYYETVCGGSGAGPGFDGESAVHTHMTNTRITDPEILEHRYPVRLERFEVRSGSGGAGRWRGGDGVVREMTFLEPVSLSLLTQHRVDGPYGCEGGAAGLAGEQDLHWTDGRVERLGSVCSVEVPAGARLVLRTPGGGGWGAAKDR